MLETWFAVWQTQPENDSNQSGITDKAGEEAGHVLLYMDFDSPSMVRSIHPILFKESIVVNLPKGHNWEYIVWGEKERVFYLCAIIKVQNDLCTIKKTKSSPVPLLEIFVPYVPLPSILPITAANGQRKWQFYTQLWYATKFSHFPLMPLACFFGFKKLSFSSVALWQLVCAHKNSNKY